VNDDIVRDLHEVIVSMCARCMANDQPGIGRKKRSMPFMSERPVFTYQTRPMLDGGQAVVLDAYAELYGRTERSLFAAIAKPQANSIISSVTFCRSSASRPASSTRCVLAWKEKLIQSKTAGQS